MIQYSFTIEYSVMVGKWLYTFRRFITDSPLKPSQDLRLRFKLGKQKVCFSVLNVILDYTKNIKDAETRGCVVEMETDHDEGKTLVKALLSDESWALHKKRRVKK